jgi:hypothetical protein
MRIQIRKSTQGRITIHPDEELAPKVKDILENELDCRITEYLQRSTGRSVGNVFSALDQNMKYSGLIEIIPPEQSDIKDIANSLHSHFEGSYLSRSGENFLISDRADDFASF